MDLKKTFERMVQHFKAARSRGETARFEPEIKAVVDALEGALNEADPGEIGPRLEQFARANEVLTEKLAVEEVRDGRALARMSLDRQAATDPDVVEQIEKEMRTTEERRRFAGRHRTFLDTTFRDLVPTSSTATPPVPAPKAPTPPPPWKQPVGAGHKPGDVPPRETALDEAQTAEKVKMAALDRWSKESKTDDVRGEFSRAADIADVSSALSQASIAQAQDAMARSQHDQAASQRVLAHTVAGLADPQTGIGSTNRPFRIQLKRAEVPETDDTPLWAVIRRASEQLGWGSYQAFIESILGCDPDAPVADTRTQDRVANRPLRLPIPDADPYRFLKAATEVFMMVSCETRKDRFTEADIRGARELGVGMPPTAAAMLQAWTRNTGGSAVPMLPYLALIRQKLRDEGMAPTWSRRPGFPDALAACTGLVRQKLEHPCFLELIWSYWNEEGMLVQAMNAISRRFQNIRTPGDRDPLATIEIDPLRPLNNILWGYIQDEQHRLTVARRAYEYDHHYGLKLVGRAVPGVNGADTRTKFVEALHNLLHVCTIFFKEADDTTVIPDGFPVLNALRDVHVVLSQGAHNQYGDLPWTARQEMLMQQWILARPEFREFLPTRIMVAYPEPWMDRVDAMKSLMGWSDTSVLHFRELAVYGERILLGARFNVWTAIINPASAANWALFWRPEIQAYVHSYRAVTGVDLTERAEATMPSTLLRSRLATQRVLAR